MYSCDLCMSHAFYTVNCVVIVVARLYFVQNKPDWLLTCHSIVKSTNITMSSQLLDNLVIGMVKHVYGLSYIL